MILYLLWSSRVISVLLSLSSQYYFPWFLLNGSISLPLVLSFGLLPFSLQETSKIIVLVTGFWIVVKQYSCKEIERKKSPFSRHLIRFSQYGHLLKIDVFIDCNIGLVNRYTPFLIIIYKISQRLKKYCKILWNQ